MAEPKFPHVKVKLSGEDGNAMMIVGRVRRAMRRAGCTDEEITAYSEAATMGSYDHLLRVTMATVDWS